MRKFQVIVFFTVLIYWAKAQNPSIASVFDVFSRARTAIRLLELDSIYFNMPGGDRDVREVTFNLFTDKNPTCGQKLVFNDSLSVIRSNFNSSKPTKILLHGYTQSLDSLDFPQSIKDAYLKIKNPNRSYNVIVVDWSVLSKEIIYFDSANYTTIAGNRIGEFVHFLKTNGFIKDYRSVHLVGFSLGAHVSGVIGLYIQQVTNGTEQIGRITGLDPAGPGFTSVEKSERLDKDDAHFVDVIHSNMGSILMGDLGSTMLMGHADFYPNGGRRQPGCEYSVFREYSLPRRSSCSHLKAIEYYEQSIKEDNKYLANKCDSWTIFQNGGCGRNNGANRRNTAIMGENCHPSTRGKFYLHTTSRTAS